MGSSSRAVPGTLRLACILAITLVVHFASAPAQAVIVNLSDNNSVAQIDADSSSGMFNWLVQGQDQLSQQWFWYRIGNNPEAAINTISPAVILQPNARSVSSTYSNATLNIKIDYLLTGGAVVGPGQTAVSDIAETITINNTSGDTLDLHFFQYSDFDLGGTPGGDTVQLGTNLGGLFNEAVQSDGVLGLSETVNSPGASHGEVAFFPVTLNKLNDALATTLSDVAGPVGPGDTTWALQWDFSIPNGNSVIISKDKLLHIQVIPEPAAMTALFAGLVACSVRRYRRAA